MPHPDLDKVEIIEPPIGELSKKPSRIKYGCFGLVAILIFAAAAMYFGVRFFAGPGAKTLSAIPADFPAGVPLYAKDNVDNITFVPGRYQTRAGVLANILPAYLSIPLIDSTALKISGATATPQNASGGAFQKIKNLIFNPPPDLPGTLRLEWIDLTVDSNFLLNHYRTELRKNKFTVSPVLDSAFSFAGPGQLSGKLSAEGDLNNKTVTGRAILIVNYPGE